MLTGASLLPPLSLQLTVQPVASLPSSWSGDCSSSSLHLLLALLCHMRSPLTRDVHGVRLPAAAVSNLEHFSAKLAINPSQAVRFSLSCFLVMSVMSLEKW